MLSRRGERGRRTTRRLALLAGVVAAALGLGTAPAVADAPPTTAVYSFGDPVRSTGLGPAGAAGLSQRYPFVLTQDAVRFRVHVRNADLLGDRLLPGALTVDGVWLGEGHGGETPDGRFAARPTRIGAKRVVHDGAGYVTPWIQPSTFGLRAGRGYLLSLGFTVPTGTDVGVAFAGTILGHGRASATAAQPAAWGGSANLLDVWIEYDVAAPPTTMLVLGHSLNTPGNLAGGATGGEMTAWPQLWARATGGIAVDDAVAGGGFADYLAPGSLLARHFPGIHPDVVSLWGASNEIAAGTSLATLQQEVVLLADRLRARWPDVRLVLVTEPPRRDVTETAAQTAVRRGYNTWLRSDPQGVDGVIDADALLAAPGDARLQPRFDSGDHAHLGLAGHMAVAGLATAVVASSR